MSAVRALALGRVARVLFWALLSFCVHPVACFLPGTSLRAVPLSRSKIRALSDLESVDRSPVTVSAPPQNSRASQTALASRVESAVDGQVATFTALAVGLAFWRWQQNAPESTILKPTVRPAASIAVEKAPAMTKKAEEEEEVAKPVEAKEAKPVQEETAKEEEEEAKPVEAKEEGKPVEAKKEEKAIENEEPKPVTAKEETAKEEEAKPVEAKEEAKPVEAKKEETAKEEEAKPVEAKKEETAKEEETKPVEKKEAKVVEANKVEPVPAPKTPVVATRKNGTKEAVAKEHEVLLKKAFEADSRSGARVAQAAAVESAVDEPIEVAEEWQGYQYPWSLAVQKVKAKDMNRWAFATSRIRRIAYKVTPFVKLEGPPRPEKEQQ